MDPPPIVLASLTFCVPVDPPPVVYFHLLFVLLWIRLPLFIFTYFLCGCGSSSHCFSFTYFLCCCGSSSQSSGSFRSSLWMTALSSCRHRMSSSSCSIRCKSDVLFRQISDEMLQTSDKNVVNDWWTTRPRTDVLSIITVRNVDPPPPRQTPPWADPLPLEQNPSPTPETATAADGTHPTGIHSCFTIMLKDAFNSLQYQCSERKVSALIRSGSDEHLRTKKKLQVGNG